uniref:ABC transporter domain-containing protein n=1 Tax=Aplanochytrium stocchinoi TaxID=215587 RepID=A0A7S3PQB0_9STRA
MNKNIREFYNVQGAIRWLAVRLELIGTGISLVASICIVIAAKNSDLSPGLAGLSLTFAMSITNLLGHTVRTFAELEAGMNSVERVLHYTRNIEQEAPYEYYPDGKVSAEKPNESFSICGSLLPKPWPSKGNIVMKNVQMRYRKDSPLVLKGVNINIEGGERIGIVGRTGGGKSSLFLSLLRLVELDYDNYVLEAQADEPSIIIDGVNIRDVGLHTLRGSISIVPQNPVIFSGTVRSNLDPYNEHTDAEIWNSIKLCNLESAMHELDAGLDSTVAEGGENFSQGQRQLLSLSKALLNNCKILMLDEATSSVDMETDSIIQETIANAFKGCTILTIAHRLQTVLDSDRILVMEDGKAGEFDTPEELLKNEDGLMYQMVHAYGKKTADRLIEGSRRNLNIA